MPPPAQTSRPESAHDEHRLRTLGFADAARLPRHIAVIMDGNGRWARSQGLPRLEGHRRGADSVERILKECARLGVGHLTLYSFSSENWRRPAEEVDALMALYEHMLRERGRELVENNIRLRQIGRREMLPEGVVRAVDEVIDATSGCTGPTLCLAVNYGARAEIVDAVRRLGERIERGEIGANDIDEASIDASLDTAGMPDPDLLIRTAGEMRLSNFLLWQISYAELRVTEQCWPDFDESSLHRAIIDFAGRRRRFGGLDSSGV